MVETAFYAMLSMLYVKLKSEVRVKDRLRLWKHGIRDLVMELCCALHNFRVRLTPWQSMI
jgi:hypothetical protein